MIRLLVSHEQSPINKGFRLDFITHWLENFSFRIELNWWLFAIPGMLILFIVLLSVSGQSIKATRQNPVESLQDA